MTICCLFPPRSSGGIWRVFDGPVVETIWRGARKSTPFWLAVTVKHRFEIVLAALPSFPSSRDRKALAKTSRRSDTESSNMPSNPRNHQYLFPFRGGNQPGSSTLHRAEMFYIAKSMPPSGPPSAAVRRHPFATPTAAAPLDLFR